MQQNSDSATLADGQVNDLGPLAWVFEELRKSLDSAGKALRRFAVEVAEVRHSDISAADPSALRVARTQLHQVVGALEMVGFQPAAMVVRGMENAVQRFLSRPLTCTEVAVSKVERAGFALIEYLEATLGGKGVSAVALFPQYKDVQELAAAQRVHPADLWEVSLPSGGFSLPGTPLPEPLVPGPAVRTQFDRYILYVIKKLHPKAAASLKLVSAGLAVGAPAPGLRSFWVVAAAYFEAIEYGLLADDVYIKRAASRVLLQYTNQAQGKQEVSATLLHDLAFFVCISSGHEGLVCPWIDAVRSRVHAAVALPESYTTATLGRHDPAVITQARKRIVAVKEGWSLLAGGDTEKARQVADQFALVADSLQKVFPRAESLVSALGRVIEQARVTGWVPPPELAMEVATAVLYIEALLLDFESANDELPTRMDELARRVENAVQGLPSLPLEIWMEELYRRVSDKQTMGSVVGELKTNLADLERGLDAFFRNTLDKSVLASVPQQLVQMKGVLSVLGMDHAASTAAHMRQSVDDLLEDEVDAARAREAGTFARLANNLSALSFLIDMLNYQPSLAKKLFVFDSDVGELRPVMGRHSAPSQVPGGDKGSAQVQPLVAEVVEQLVTSDESVNLTALTERLGEIADQATLADNQPLAHAARQAVSAVSAGPQDGAMALAELVELAAPPAPVQEVVSSTEADVLEDDLLDIFLEEARDVTKAGQAAVESLRDQPDALADQTTLRRAFHTLKGSSRMVGLTEFGEAAWAMEQVMNAWLASFKPVSTELADLCADALDQLARWVEDIAAQSAHDWAAKPFQEASEAMRMEGRRLPLMIASGPAITPRPSVVEEHSALPELVTEQPSFADTEPMSFELHGVTEPATDMDMLEMDFDSLLALSGKNDSQEVREVPESKRAQDADFDWALPADDVHNAQLSEDALAISGLESDEALTVAASQPSELLEESALVSEEESSVELVVSDVALLSPEARVSDAEQVGQLAAEQIEDVKSIGHLTIGTRLFNVFLSEADDWSRRLAQTVDEWLPVHSASSMPAEASALAHSIAGASGAIGFTELSGLAKALEHALDAAVNRAQAGNYPDEAAARLISRATDDVQRLLHQFAAGFLKAPAAGLVDELEGYVHLLVDAEPPQPESAQERSLQAAIDNTVEAVPDVDAILGDEIWQSIETHEPAQALDVPAVPNETIISASQPFVADAVPTAPRVVVSLDDDIDAEDALDADLFQIFDEEAQELLPRLGAALRLWTQTPSSDSGRSEVLRTLHTLKGSARLAGALRLGEMAHRMETQAERIDAQTGPDVVTSEALLASYDGLVARLDELRLPESVSVANRTASAIEFVPAPQVPEPAHVSEPKGELPSPQTALQPQPLRLPSTHASASGVAAVRVRPDLLDRLVNQAGEVMITRSKMEGELSQLRTSLTDLTDNLDRLRHQLRDIELQAESQMQSRLAQAKETHQTFDPLEFDRFTRVQELTRMMAESVNDVATVQRNLQRAVDATEDGLTAQARQTRELQRDLLRTRMVEFEGIADRLYRVVRQASKEAGKQVRLDIVGGSIEMDRGVLDKMTPAFEHLLRNCVVHGIESAVEREGAGKSPEGRITIQLAQEGNDVSVSFADDGRGLDLTRIAAKAEALGLVTDAAALSTAEVAQLVFAQGLTTAAEVTGLAGRGIGMDVVRSEVVGLGGRIDIHTEPGQGTRFDMVLPLTTAVTQVVIVRAGDFSMGVPSGLVEVVRRMSPQELAHAYEIGAVSIAGENVPFYWMGALLQVSRHSGVAPARSTPVVIFRSAAQRVALHVDEVLGNQEVVVKNLGPQLSRLPGLAATTVLASGAVSLIYNPVALSALYGAQVRGWVEQGEPPKVDHLGGVEVVRQSDTGLPAQPPLVLVVDDSITVRRVTQRLLVREGYRVVLATDGLQALERLEGERPAVVLSDIEMPRMDGFDLVRNIRNDPRLADLPVIMITSRIAEKHREHAQQLGVDHYLGKPYSEDELLHWIQHYCAERLAQTA